MLMTPVISNFDKPDKKQRKISVMEQFAKRVAVQTRKIQLPKSKKFSELQTDQKKINKIFFKNTSDIEIFETDTLNPESIGVGLRKSVSFNEMQPENLLKVESPTRRRSFNEWSRLTNFIKKSPLPMPKRKENVIFNINYSDVNLF